MKKKVIVVGARMAGLAAAQVLHRRGLDVSVLESASRVGASRRAPEILQEVLAWLGERWPGLPGAVVAHRVQRWPLAEPLSPPGRARAVQHYRASLPAGRRVFLCGDSTGLPWTDGAVETGLWAAARVVEELA